MNVLVAVGIRHGTCTDDAKAAGIGLGNDNGITGYCFNNSHMTIEGGGACLPWRKDYDIPDLRVIIDRIAIGSSGGCPGTAIAEVAAAGQTELVSSFIGIPCALPESPVA